MPKIKDTPKVDRPRERFLKKGPEALSKSDLLAIVLGSGIKGKNVQKLAQQIIKKFSTNFLDVTVDDLQTIEGIGPTKALQVASAISLVKRFYDEKGSKENLILSAKDVVSLNSDLKNKKREYLVCLYLNARNALLKKETISIGTLDKSLIHPREIFGPAMDLRAASVILIHNHPSGNPKPSKQDVKIVNKIVEAGKIMGINVIDFIIVAGDETYSSFENLRQSENIYYISDGIQHSLFDLLEAETSVYTPITTKVHKVYFSPKKRSSSGKFQIQNRRFLGNKYKLLGFIEDIVNEKCNGFDSFCDIFAGTGVVGARFNGKDIKVISNDLLFSNYFPLKTFLGLSQIDLAVLKEKIDVLNKMEEDQDNYFSIHFGNTYFTLRNARKIGAIREKIEKISDNEDEKATLITSLLYATDKAANTVGHYDAYRKKLDTVQPIELLIPDITLENNSNNEVVREDANLLIRKIYCDVLYIDPPYNSRQYCDAYHLLENLATWKKPQVYGKAKKMDRKHLKSKYCLKTAPQALDDLIRNANCRHILVSYNSTGESKDGRSNARIKDSEIVNSLENKGEVEVFERDYKAFTTGKSNTDGHTERLFYCRVTK